MVSDTTFVVTCACHILFQTHILLPGYNHTTLMINNLGRGPARDLNVVEDSTYKNLDTDASRAWFLPHHGNTEFTGRH